MKLQFASCRERKIGCRIFVFCKTTVHIIVTNCSVLAATHRRKVKLARLVYDLAWPIGILHSDIKHWKSAYNLVKISQRQGYLPH